MKHTLIIVLATAIMLCAVGVAAWYVYVLVPKSRAEQAVSGRAQGETISALIEEGKLEAARAYYESVRQSATGTPVNTASSVITGSAISYMMSGNPQDAIQSVRDLREVAIASEVRPFIRAAAILRMAQMYELSAYNRGVFDEIFARPFRRQLVLVGGQPDPMASIRRLLGRSYNESPTFSAAIAIAYNSAARLYRNEALGYDTDENEKLHIEDAEKYLALADDLFRSPQYEQPTPAPRARDAYIVGRARVIGMLAHFKGEPYRAQYASAYESALAHLQNENNAVAIGLIPHLRYWYAGHLFQIDGNTDAAREQLSQATAEAQAYRSEYLKMDSLSSVLRNLKVVAPVFEAPIAHAELLKISPELTALYESL